MSKTFKSPKCKVCKTDTDMIGSWADGENDLALYQCPKCKTVVMKVLTF